MSEQDDAWPNELRVADKGRVLRVSFVDGHSFDLPAEYLRVMSPSAEVQGHSPRDRKLVTGKRGCVIVGVEPVGSYAVRLSFDDRHQTGLYTWAYLYELGVGQAERWQAYLDALVAAGASRDEGD